MKNRNEFPKLNDSLFNVIDNKKLSFIVGGTYTCNTCTVTYSQSTKTTTVGDDGNDSYPGE